MALVPSAALQVMVALRDAWFIPSALAGAVLVGLVWAVVRPAPDRPARLVTAAGLAPVVFWAPYFGAVALHDGALSFPPEIWSGTLAWSGLAMLSLAALALKVRATPGTTADSRSS
jgi:hypothetical protein